MTGGTLMAAVELDTASHRQTNDVVFDLLCAALAGGGRALDLGAGQGAMSRRLAAHLAAAGCAPADRIVACDLFPEQYRCPEVPFVPADLARPLPFKDGEFDVVYSIEVFEHVGAVYALMAEARRVLKPGGLLLFTVPNTLHATSRLSLLWNGFFDLYHPPTAVLAKAGRICGHIMPLSYAYFAYGLRRAGYRDIRLHRDRRKKSAMFWATLLYPLFALGGWRYRRKIQAYDREVYEENREVLELTNSWTMLTSRSCVIVAR